MDDKILGVDYIDWFISAITIALLFVILLLTFEQITNIKCEVLDPTINTCFCGEQIDENNFKNMEIGVIKFYDEGIYCQLKEMEIKIDN